MNGKTAVVLAGGGSRGAYQLGVWRALRQLKIEYQIVTGTSVGALNGVLMVQQDYEQAQAVWENISYEKVLQGAPSGREDPWLWAGFAKKTMEQRGVDVTPLEGMIRSLVDEERFYRSPIDYALVTVEYPSLRPLELRKEQIPPGMLGEYLMASASCFPAFPTKEIGGNRYVDGGYHDNMPVNLAIQMGARRVIAVDLESVGRMPRIHAGGRPVTVIRPSWNLGSFLQFEPGLARRNIELGYLDTMKALGQLEGYLYAFDRESWLRESKFIQASARELLDALREADPGGWGSLERKLLIRQEREFLKKSQGLHPYNPDRMVLLAAEACGECLGADPLQRYDFGRFQMILRNLWLQKRPQTPPEEWEGLLAQLHRRFSELSAWDQTSRVHLILGRIAALLRGEGSMAQLQLLAGAFTKEFWAALYLCVIANRFGQKKEEIQHE